MLPKPNAALVEQYLKKWKESDRFSIEMEALDKLFRSAYPSNTDLKEILIKVRSLNSLYHARVNDQDCLKVAEIILRQAIDGDLQNESITVVEKLCNACEAEDMKKYQSFFSKYCAFHKSDVFSPYDGYARMALEQYCRDNVLHNIGILALRNYNTYCDAIKQLRDTCSLGKYSLREIDHWLWLMGQEFFRRT